MLTVAITIKTFSPDDAKKEWALNISMPMRPMGADVDLDQLVQLGFGSEVTFVRLRELRQSLANLEAAARGVGRP